MSDDNNPFDSMSSRAIGVFMLVAGAVLCYLGVISPLRAMRSGAASVSYSMSAAAITPLVLVMGALWAAFGERAEKLLGHPQRPTRGTWVLSALLVAAGLWLYFWVKSQLAVYGYSQ